MHHQDPSLTYGLACFRRNDLLSIGVGERPSTITPAGSFVRGALLIGRCRIGAGLVHVGERLIGESGGARRRISEGSVPSALQRAAGPAN